jgi:hypothetical protein
VVQAVEPLLAEAVGRLLPADAGVYGAFPRQRDDNYVHTTFTDEFYTVLGGGLSVQHPGMTARVCSLGQVSEGSQQPRVWTGGAGRLSEFSSLVMLWRTVLELRV